MKKHTQLSFPAAAGFLAAFALWTIAVKQIDVQAIGPQQSTVGFAALNSFIHSLTGVHMALYTITDWLSLVPLGFIAGFGLLGLVQWIRRKRLRRVDFSLLALGGFYIIILAAYALFEIIPVNYRPVLIGGALEASYPSSTTMLVLCTMPTATMQLRSRTENSFSGRCASFALSAFTAFMVIGRLLSGVHWFTDIVGGILLSAGLVMLYRAVCALRPE